MENTLGTNQCSGSATCTLEKTTGPMCWIDREGRIIHFNKALEQLTGFTEKRLKSIGLNTIEPSLDKATLETRLDLLQKKGALSWETEFVNAEGTRLPVSVNAIVVESKDEGLACMQVKPKEEVIAHRSEFLAACLNEHRIAAWEWDLTTNSFHASDFFFELFEMNKAQQISLTNFFNLIRPWLTGFQLESLKKTVAELQKRPFDFKHEVVLYHRNGMVRKITVSGQPIYKNGLPILIRGHLNEISPATEDRSETLARKLTALSPMLIFWVNQDLSLRYANPAALQALGHSEDELNQGLYWPDLCDSSSQADFSKMFHEKTSEKDWSHSLNLKGKNGRIIPVEYGFEYIEMEPNSMVCISAKAIGQSEHEVKAQLRSSALEGMRLAKKLEHKKINLQMELTHTHDNFLTLTENYLGFLKNLEKVSKAAYPVMLLGEDESSKKLMARTLHLLSDRGDYPLIKIDCSRIPSQTLEKELFGYEKNLYEITTEEIKGRIEAADGGTLLLDNISELSISIQDKLCLLLKDGKYVRIGSKTTRMVNVRVVGTTKQDLGSLVAEGRFNKELFMQLNKGFVYYFPLQQEEREATGSEMTGIDLQPLNVGLLEAENAANQSTMPLISLEEKQRQHILKALKLTGGRVSGKKGAAVLLEIHPQTLFSKMRKLGIKNTEKEKTL